MDGLLAARGVTVDDDGNILVADYSNNHIQKFTSDGKFITSLGENLEKKPLEFDQPMGVAIHPFNKKMYSYSGLPLSSYSDPEPCMTLHSPAALAAMAVAVENLPTHGLWILIAPEMSRYVTDTQSHHIQVFTAEGQFLRKFWKKGSGNGELNTPAGISIDSDNVVYVADCWNHRVSVFTSMGKFLTSFGTKGSEPGQFNLGPRGITVDKNGVVYVSDTDNNRLQIF